MLKHSEPVCADGAVCGLESIFNVQAVFKPVAALTFLWVLRNSFLVKLGYVESLFRPSLPLSFTFSILNFLLDHQSTAHPYYGHNFRLAKLDTCPVHLLQFAFFFFNRWYHLYGIFWLPLQIMSALSGSKALGCHGALP